MSEPPPSPPAGPAGASGSQGAAASTSAAAAGCASARSLASPGGSSSGSPEASPALAGATAAEPPQPSGGLAAAGLQPSGSGRLGRLLLRMHLRRQPLRPKLLRQQQTVPVDEVRGVACCREGGRRQERRCRSGMSRRPGWGWGISSDLALRPNRSPCCCLSAPAAAAAGGAAEQGAALERGPALLVPQLPRPRQAGVSQELPGADRFMFACTLVYRS